MTLGLFNVLKEQPIMILNNAQAHFARAYGLKG